MFASLFNSLTEKDKSEAVRDLIGDSTPRPSFFLMVAFSVFMATFGLLINNTSVIIGSMLIAPILSPILSLSLGIVMSDFRLIGRSFMTVAKSAALAVAIAVVSTVFFPNGAYGFGSEIFSRADSSLVYFAIAVAAGLAVSFARVRPEMSETLPGIAISVALIPPISVTGIGLARLDWGIASGSFLLFVTNVIGIVFASMLVFSLMNFYVKREVAATALAKEEKELEKEKELVQKNREEAK